MALDLKQCLLCNAYSFRHCTVTLIIGFYFDAVWFIFLETKLTVN
jgi:hypothetical protein